MSNKLTINFLKSEDLTGLKNLYEKGFESSPTSIDKMLGTFELIKADKNYNILCAKINSQVVGSVMGVACHELFGDCQPFMVVENVVVLKEFRKQGIAKQLLTRLEKRAKELNCSMILFVSSAHRKGAHKLYESLGFGEDKVNGFRKQISYE